MIGSNTVRATVRATVNAREARIVTIPDTSPTLGCGPSARFMPVNFVSAKKLWTCLATGSHECGRRLLWPCMVDVAVHHCDFPLL